MTLELEEALARWESGELSRDELARRFPDHDIQGILEVFERMQAAATGPAPDVAAAWEAFRATLPARIDDRRRRSNPMRLLAVAAVALFLTGATAYAFVPGVRKAMSGAVESVTGEDTPSHAPDPREDESPPADPDPADETAAAADDEVTGTHGDQTSEDQPGDETGQNDGNGGGETAGDQDEDADEGTSSGEDTGSVATDQDDGGQEDSGSEHVDLPDGDQGQD